MRLLRGGFPRFIEYSAQRAEEYTRGLLSGGILFEELGFYYVGPIDGQTSITYCLFSRTFVAQNMGQSLYTW